MRSVSARFLLVSLVILISSGIGVPPQTPALPWRTLTSPGAPRPKGTAFYVSPEGNDGWSGKRAEPNGSHTDGPFATLERARDAIRSLQPLGKPATVYLRGGVYPRAATFVLLPQDSGTAQAPITYAAYPGEKVILSGGRNIAGWHKSNAPQPPGVELWTAPVPGVKEGKWYFHQLFADGRRLQRARAPHQGFFHVDGQFEEGTPTRFKFRPGDLHSGWAEQGDVEVVGLEKWAEFRMILKSIDTVSHTATLSSARQPFGNDQHTRYWVENAADALEAPGDWYLDRRTGTLSYLATPGEDVAHEQFFAPYLAQLVRLEGTERSPDFVHDVVLRGLTFAYTDWALPSDGYVDTQAAYDIPAAVELRRARQCHIEQGTFAHLGQYAVHIWKGSHDNQVTGDEMTDLGAGGIKVGGWSLPETPDLGTGGTTVLNNYIHDIGIVYPAAVGVWIGQSNGNTVAHNEIADTYYTAISLGWTWGYGPTAAHDNHIEFNKLYNIGRGLLSDMGCIYSLGVQPGTTERNNLCHDVSRFSYGGWGIYTDEGSSHILIENNIVYRTEDGGFHQHYGRENVVRNNIFAFGEKAQIRRSREEDHLSFTFEHNIVSWQQGKLLDGTWKNNHFQFDYNLYWQAAGEPIEFDKDSLTEWQKRGQDVHSLVADPLFTDPDRGDLTLKPGSPATKIGFKPIDATQIGPRK